MRSLGSGHVTCGPMGGLKKNCTRWHRQTDIQTDGHGDSMTESAQCQWADSVKTCFPHHPEFILMISHFTLFCNSD